MEESLVTVITSCPANLCVFGCVPLFVGPMVCSQASLPMEFSGRGCWGGLSFPPPHLPNPGIEPSLLSCQVHSLPLLPPMKSNNTSILMMSQNAWSHGGYKCDNKVSPSEKLASLIALLVKNPPAMRETLIRLLGQEDLLEKGQATHSSVFGLPLWLSWQRICLQCRRPGFGPWFGRIPWRGEGLPTPVFCLGELHGPCSLWGRKESDTTEQFSLSSVKLQLLSIVFSHFSGFSHAG